MTQDSIHMQQVPFPISSFLVTSCGENNLIIWHFYWPSLKQDQYQHVKNMILLTNKQSLHQKSSTKSSLPSAVGFSLKKRGDGGDEYDAACNNSLVSNFKVLVFIFDFCITVMDQNQNEFHIHIHKDKYGINIKMSVQSMTPLFVYQTLLSRDYRLKTL